MDKKSLRLKMMEKRGQLDAEEIASKSEKIQANLFQLKEFKNANFIFSFISFKDEVHTHSIIKDSLDLGKRIGVPKTIKKPRQLLVSEIKDFDKELEIGYYNILAPKKEFERIVDPKLVDLVLVPGLAFDKYGFRLGYGGGYYDRFFEKIHKNIPKIAICFNMQIVDIVPTDSYDIPVDYIITESKIIRPIYKKSK